MKNMVVLIEKATTKHNRKQKNIRKFYRKIIFIVFPILIGIAVTITVVVFSLIGNSISEDYQKVIIDSANTVEKNFSEAMNDVIGTCISIYNSAEGTQIRLGNKKSEVYNSFSKSIINGYDDIPFVQSICIFSKKDNEELHIINDSIGRYYNSEAKNKLKEIISEQEDIISYKLWKAENRYLNKSEFDLLSVCYSLSSLENSKEEGTIVANIDIVELSEYLFSHSKNENITYYVLNQNGDVIVSSDENYNGKNISNRFGTRFGTKEEFDFKNQEFLLNKHNIEGTDYEFCLLSSRNPSFSIVVQAVCLERIEEIYNNLLPTLIIIWSLTIIGGAIFLLLSLKVFAPFNHILDYIRSSGVIQKEKLAVDELKMLDLYCQFMKERVEELQEKEVKNQIEKLLLKSQSVDELLVCNGYMHPGKNYRLLLIGFSVEGGQDLKLKDYEEYRNRLEIRCINELSIYGKCVCFTTGLRRLMLLIEEKESLVELEAVLEKYFSELQLDYNYSIKAYLSEIITYAENKDIISPNYRKAESCLHTAYFINKPGMAMLIKESQKHIDWENDLKHVKQCVESRDLEAFEIKVRKMLEGLEGQSWEVCKTLFFQLLLSVEIALAKTQNERSLSIKLIENIDYMSNQDEFWSRLHNLVFTTKEKMEKKETDAAVPILERVLNHIDANYQNKDFNLSGIADVMHISASYLGKLFRDFTGEGFNEYLMRIRLEHACELLVNEPDMKVSLVGETVGYSNNSYFISTFKKVYGVTPSMYRRMYGEMDM